MAERTHISPHSNIGELAGVFDTMAGDLERHVNQQRELLNAVSHELRTPLTRLDFGLVLLFDEVPPASRKRLLELVGHVRELDELVLELLSYSRLYNADQARERVEVSLLELVDSVLGGFAEELDGRGYPVGSTGRGQFAPVCAGPTADSAGGAEPGAQCHALLRRKPVAALASGGRWRLSADGSRMTGSVYRWRSGNGFSSRSTGWTAAATATPAGLAWGWRSAGGRSKGRAGTLTVAQSALGGAQFRIRLPAG